jgi:DNA-directed RNA polymerase subunit L
MAETLEERQERIVRELQALLSVEVPDSDFSIGTVLYELLVKPAAVTFANQETELDELRNSMSLVQVLQDPTASEESVDNLLANYNVARREGSRATGLINVYVSTTNNVYIEPTAVITCGGTQLNPTKAYVAVFGEITTQDTPDVSYVSMRQFDDTLYVFSIEATTIENTETVLSPGQRCTISTQDSFIRQVEVGSTFTGGSIEETNEELLIRAATSINSKVVTGRDNIQSLLEGNDSGVEVLDVGAFGMGDELQLRDKDNAAGVSTGGHVDVYVTTSPVPSQATAALTGTRDSEGVWSIEIPRETFAGAYGVTEIRNGTNIYNTDIVPVFGYELDEGAPRITEPIHARYSKYQTLTVQFVASDIDASITEQTFDVDVLFMPGLNTLQEYMQGADIRSYAFDTLVKGTIPVLTSVAVTVEYVQGITPPDLSTLQQAVSDEINLQRMRVSSLESSKVVYALRGAFPAGDVRMPVVLSGKIFLPDGSTAFATDPNRLVVPEMEGVGYENTDFFCFPENVEVTLVEVLL